MFRFDLKNIETKRDLDKYCQMAIVTASLATIEQIREDRPSVLPSCVAAAGFSLGEITALIFGGAMSLEEGEKNKAEISHFLFVLTFGFLFEGLKVVNIRNLAMEAASKEHPGGMMTIMFQADANVSLACQEAIEYCIKNGVNEPVCNIANYLYPHCKVISGSKKVCFLQSLLVYSTCKPVKCTHISGARIFRTKRHQIWNPTH